jgi:E3 ubiquitin-protein ligase UBR7
MVVRNEPYAPWNIIGDTSTLEDDKSVEVSDEGVAMSTGTKRPRSPSVADSDSPETKRARASPGPANASVPCLAPPPNMTAHKIFASRDANDLSLGAGDLFLTNGWRERWCRCNSVGRTFIYILNMLIIQQCCPSLETRSFLLEEEETFEPPEDPDSGLSLEELGMRALQHLPRDRAIDGIHAFNNMRYVYVMSSSLYEG